MAGKIYDAIVVGSGANGGWAAKQLCEAGMEVCMLEAGEQLDPQTDFSEHLLPYELPLRGRQDPRNGALERRPVQRLCYACGETNADFFLDDVDNPSTFTPGKEFRWIQGNKVGGRTIMWGRQSYRFSDLDFKAKSHDGYGDDWPIGYDDLAPYYDLVERYIGVSGRREGFAVLPDGQFLPPMAYSCGEVELKKAVERMGRQLTIGRAAVLTRQHEGRDACHYCGPCHRGCRTASYFSSPVSTLPAAEKTGKLTLVTGALAYQVLTGDDGLASGISYVDKATSKEEQVEAKVVVLAASTLASARILLNSAPGGLGNSSGVLGRYLMDHHFAVGASGHLPLRKGAVPELANRPNGIYIPRFRNVTERHQGFIRGYGYQGGESVTVFEHAYTTPGFGADWKHALRGENLARIGLTGFGETLARRENRCFIDDSTVDAWGIPVLSFDISWSDNELAMSRDMVEQAVATLEELGCEEIEARDQPAPPGFCIHEVGTARMGTDAKTSYLSPFQQSHDIRNLFVMDGSAHVSIGCVNPTLTMMALTVRSCEHLIAEAKRGNLA